MASELPSSASPTPQPGIKTRSSPAAFPTTLCLSVPPPFSSSLSCTGPLVPKAASSSTDSLPAPWSPQNRYDAASGKNVASATAGFHSPDASATLSRLTVRPVRRPHHNDADEALGVSAGRRRPGHATTSDAEPLLPLLQALSTDPPDLLTPPPWSTRPRQHGH